MKLHLTLSICTLVYITFILDSCSKQNEPFILKEKASSGENLQPVQTPENKSNQSSDSHSNPQSSPSNYTPSSHSIPSRHLSSSSSESSGGSDVILHPSSSDPGSYDLEINEYISEIPTNPNRTLGSLLSNSGCSLFKCSKSNCYVQCPDIEKFKANITSSDPDSTYGNSYDPISCPSNSSYNMLITPGIYSSTTIDLNTNIESKQFDFRTCTQRRTYFFAKNTAINKKPKTFKVLIAYTGVFELTGYTNTGVSFTVFKSISRIDKVIDVLFEKITCTGTSTASSSCLLDYPIGFRQNGGFINPDDEIKSGFSILHCKSNGTQTVYTSCSLK